MTRLDPRAKEIPLEVYRSSRHELMYVYLPTRPETVDHAADESGSDDESGSAGARADLSVLPQALLERFGTPIHTLSFVLTSERKLAAADAVDVMTAIREQGFYLQMPPTLHVERTTATPDARNPHEGR